LNTEGGGSPFAGYGWSWLMLRAMPHSFGIALEILLVVGILWALFRPKPGTLSMVAFLAVEIAALVKAKCVFHRYLLIPLPAMAMLAGVFVSDLTHAAASKVGRRPALIATAVVLGLILAPSLIRDVELNRFLPRSDTRALARQWIEDHVPPDDRIAARQGYGTPRLPIGQIVNVEELSSLRVKHVHWVLWDDFTPLTFYSSPPPDWLLAQARTQATLVFDADPMRPGGGDPPAFDAADAFYAPLTNITSMERPGPRIRIWKLK